MLLLLLIGCNVGCDQVSKSIVRKELGDQEQIRLFANHLTLLKVENTGAFLSFGETMPEEVKFVFLTFLPLLLLAYGIYVLLRRPQLQRAYAIGLCFLIGGGLGNLYDRLLHGSVTDFLHLNMGFFETGIFNLADVSVVIGTLLLFIQIYSKEQPPWYSRVTTLK